MEVRAGYKQTEVGVIPEGWDARRLGELVQSSRNVRYGIVQPGKYCASGGFMLRSQDYSRGWAGPEGMHKVSAELGAQFKNARIQGGDLVITVVGAGIGQIEFIPEWLDGAFLSRSTARIAIDESKSAPNFVKAFLEGPVGKRQILDCQKEGAQPVVSCPDLAKFFVAYPPPEEQRAIATALSDVDALLAAQDKLIAKKRDIKQAAMQQLLTGKKRLPGFGGDWSIISMAKHATLKARIGWQALTTEEYLDSGTHFLVTGTDFIGGRVHWSTCHFVDKWRYNQDPNIQLKEGDVLVTKDGTIGKVGYVENLSSPATLNSGVFVIRPLGMSFVPLFLLYILTSTIFDEFLSKITAGSTITHLYQKDFITFAFSAPCVQEQVAIANILSDMDADLTALEQQRDKTRALKQGMMQELLTGRIRLV